MAQVAFLVLPTLSSGAGAMTVEDAVAAGIARNPQIAAASSEASAAKRDVDVAKASYLPSVSVSGGPQDTTPDKWGYEVTAAQMVHDWGQAKSQVRGARAAQRQREDEWLVTRDDAVLDLVETYLDVLLARRQRDVDLAQIATLRDFAQMTGIRAQSGYADRSEPDRAQLELARAHQRLAIDEGTIADAASQFETLVGAMPDELVEPSPPSMILSVDGQDLAALVETAPLYRKALEDTNQARAQFDETRAAILPRVNLEATALSREIGGRMQSDAIVAVRLRMNPMQGLSSFDRVKGARERIDAAQWKEVAVRRDIERRLRNLVTNGTALAEQERALERQVANAGELGSLYREQFEVGRRDIIDLVTVQREHYDARRSLNEVHLQLIRVQYQMAAQLGRLADVIDLGERLP
ncbi:TolC family protein [Novosphingobium sp. BL-52-GroH]|uniref:TolC family protein n=1 Tax=Novosphingobium sp. BL-52-GroH TaxID=3349877 RepID=UPI00384D6F5B